MIAFGRDLTSNFDVASRREWLMTDGLGGWASGTVSGANTRRYHGLFIPALMPPLGRTVLVTKFNEWLTVSRDRYPLSCNEYADGTIDPVGFRHIESFRLENDLPVWTYSFSDVQIQKRIWLGRGTPAAYVAYHYCRGSRPVTLEVTPMVAARDAHGETRSTAWTPEVRVATDGTHVVTPACGFWIKTNRGSYEPSCVWHRGIKHRMESERGLPDLEDQFAAGTFTVTLEQGHHKTNSAGVIFAMTLDDAPPPQWPASRRRSSRKPEAEPAWITQLKHAADQFLVRRGKGNTVIAGYHWFGDWGRDTMISLPGLCLATKRFAEAASILKTWAQLVSQGMLPNHFPDTGNRPEYNTVDAALWYVHAMDRYAEATGDLKLVRDLWPVLEDMIGWHLRGTRYHIHVDPTDGLLHAGEPGMAVTWMDAKIGDWVVTPRIGKPVEINALWINALRVMDVLVSQEIAVPAHDYIKLAERATTSFERYWNPDTGCLFDVIDGPEGHDPAIRPNQLLAVSLPHAPLAPESPRAKAIVDVCAEHLLTSYGLRSLSPHHPAYIGTYAGDGRARDSAYHQGTVWSWLIGPFADAHYRVHRSAAHVLSFLAPFEQHLSDYGLGSIAEVFDGNPPHTPRGCIAQAWSVAEVLRVWVALQERAKGKREK